MSMRRSLLRYYTVVGILERMEDSEMLLEKLIPQYFKGLSELRQGM